MRFYRYILAYDSGRAPCVDSEFVTLATCKPTIRRCARVRDWVAGFMPRPHERGQLVYAGRVAEVVEWPEYTKRYPNRTDAVYRVKDDGAVERLDPSYHDNANLQRKDLSAPILLFDKNCTWYFGRAPIRLPCNLQHLAAAGRGHRVAGATVEDIEAFEHWLRGNRDPGVHRVPRNPGQRFSCRTK